MEHRARKRFGQHFLHDQEVVHRIVGTLGLQPGELVIEIGPGKGVLTAPLLEAGARVIAVEIDRDLVAELRTRFVNEAFEIVSADILKADIAALTDDRPLRLIGNLPYNISTPLMFHVLQSARHLRDMHFMVQKEVADRMAAQPGSKTYGRLTVMLGAQLQIQRLFDVPPGAFRPPPQVDSSVVRLIPHPQAPAIQPDHQATFELVVRHCFSQRRKTLRKSLSAWMPESAFGALSMSPTARPEELTIVQFAELAAAVFGHK
jgi:16S rRNA (adenine1518-N6/adenine1519-N6)-dimethyltransferase